MVNTRGLLARIGALVLAHIFLFTSLPAELLIVKTNNNGIIQPINVSTEKPEQLRKLYQVMIRYHWPSSTAYRLDMTLKEKQLLFAPVASAEKTFIRPVIKNTVDPS